MNTKIKSPIFLCGMMGSGKSTIGKLLANKLGFTFSDLDEIIESETGLSIPDIFASKGEKVFRKIEAKTMINHVQSATGVTALGGGSLQKQLLVEHLKIHGWLIFLDAPVHVLAERLKSSEHRPMLKKGQNPDPSERIRTLLEKRRPMYTLAHITIETNDMNADEVVNEIIRRLTIYEA